jgi:hypothetical protein
MARSLGIPARVAVGFTEGDRDPTDPRRFQVRGIHAHAWPEVYFPGHGWVPFEPTPGRGIPGAESYTGIAPEQAESSETQPTVSVVTTTTPSAPSSAPSSIPGSREEQPTRGATIRPDDAGEENPWFPLARWALALVAAWLVVLLVAPRVRAATRNGDGPGGAVLGAWADALDPIRWTTGMRPRPSETHAEFARRAGPELGDQAAPVDELATLSERAAWDLAPADEDDAARATELARGIRAELRTREPIRRRVLRRLSWREAFGLEPGRRPGPARRPLGDPLPRTDVVDERERERVG